MECVLRYHSWDVRTCVVMRHAVRGVPGSGGDVPPTPLTAAPFLVGSWRGRGSMSLHMPTVAETVIGSESGLPYFPIGAWFGAHMPRSLGISRVRWWAGMMALK
jgi:hypothetical protein